MMSKLQGFKLQRVFLTNLLSLTFSCSGAIWEPLSPALAKDVGKSNILPSAYWDAVEDARVPEPQEVFRNLSTITPHNPTLTWNEHGHVLVVVWTIWNGYARNVGNQMILTRDLWVTVVPDLQKFCRKYIPTNKVSLATRINQLLGLPPETVKHAANRQMVEIWVDPKWLFRPSPDPEITDREAELSFRTSNEFISVSPSYQQWFYAQYDQRYQHKGQPIVRNSKGQPIVRNSTEISESLPYPWTQLGYTYDWGKHKDWKRIDPNRPKKVGLSEFVIRKWSPISVKASQSGDDYCSSSD